MDFFNIQSRPTPRLYEKRKNMDIFIDNFMSFSFGLINAVIRTVVVSVGNFAQGRIKTSYALAAAELRTVIVNVGSFPNEMAQNFLLAAAELRTVVINVGSYSQGQVETSYALKSAELKTVIISVGTYTHETALSFSLKSASLV